MIQVNLNETKVWAQPEPEVVGFDKCASEKKLCDLITQAIRDETSETDVRVYMGNRYGVYSSFNGITPPMVYAIVNRVYEKFEWLEFAK